MRLIDADALMEQLREANRQCNNDIVKCCIGLVQTQPTAYNVDAVVAELGEFQKEAMSCAVKWAYEKSINAVKRGGVE